MVYLIYFRRPKAEILSAQLLNDPRQAVQRADNLRVSELCNTDPLEVSTGV